MKKEKNLADVPCVNCKHEKALPFGIKCRKCNVTTRSNFENKIPKLKKK